MAGRAPQIRFPVLVPTSAYQILPCHNALRPASYPVYLPSVKNMLPEAWGLCLLAYRLALAGNGSFSAFRFSTNRYPL
jgi:hypothetical protein